MRCVDTAFSSYLTVPRIKNCSPSIVVLKYSRILEGVRSFTKVEVLTQTLLV